MEIQILNTLCGDKERNFDTSTEEGRKAAAELIGDLLSQGSALFLERNSGGETETYRVTGYDPATDRLTLQTDTATEVPDSEPVKGSKGKKSKVPSSSGKVVAAAPAAGG